MADPSVLSSRLRLMDDVVETSWEFAGGRTFGVPFLVAIMNRYRGGLYIRVLVVGRDREVVKVFGVRTQGRAVGIWLAATTMLLTSSTRRK